MACAHKRRARARFDAAAFLHARAAEDLAERLEAIPRRFARALALGAPDLMQRAIAARPDLSARIGRCERADVVAPAERIVDLEALDLGEGRYDLIVSPLLLHWANDLPGALAMLRRALAPDGLLLATLFGADTLAELRHVLIAAESEVRGGASLRVGPFADLYDLAGLLQRAGLALPAADRDTVTVRYGDPLQLLADLRAMGETSALRERGPPLTRDILGRALALYRARFSDPDGRVRASFELITITGWAPHPSQQQPLRPGSARQSLADALGTKELPLKRED